jgi:hypothetical protein
MQEVGNTTAMAEVVRGVRVDRRFYMAMAICAIVIAVLGFAPSSLDPTARRGPLTPLVAAHAANVHRLARAVLRADGTGGEAAN